MFVGPHVRGVPALGDDAGVGPLGTVGVKLIGAVRLVLVFALPAIEAGKRLRADADALAGLDEGHLGSDAERGSDNLCTKEV